METLGEWQRVEGQLEQMQMVLVILLMVLPAIPQMQKCKHRGEVSRSRRKPENLVVFPGEPETFADQLLLVSNLNLANYEGEGLRLVKNAKGEAVSPVCIGRGARCLESRVCWRLS